MTTKIKELNLLDVEDIEKALSEYFEREIKLSEVECVLTYCVPADGSELDGSYLQFIVGDDECDSFDLFEDEDEGKDIVNGKVPSYYNDCLSPEDVFNFSVSAFKSFEMLVDNSD